MPQKITLAIPEATPTIYLDFLNHLMKKFPVTHPHADYTITMKHTKTVGGRPGTFFGSRPVPRNYVEMNIALGQPGSPHPFLDVLNTIAHEYMHVLQFDEMPPRERGTGRADELEADLFALRELFEYTGDSAAVKRRIQECYKGTQKFLEVNPEVKAGLFRPLGSTAVPERTWYR